jgi:hypothetical protein
MYDILQVDYCFKNDAAACGYTGGYISSMLTPTEPTDEAVERLLEKAAVRENRPLIFVGYTIL